MSENNDKRARQAFDTLCTTYEQLDWKYEKNEDELTVECNVSGEDLPIRIIVIIDAKRQLIRMLSPLPFTIDESHRNEAALVTCYTNYMLADGSFDYDYFEGHIFFRMTSSFKESLIGTELFRYMIACACTTIDEYNDKFLAVSKGLLSVDDFIKNL